MLIVCPSCATSYDVEPASLQPNGRQVRCVRCRTVWRAESTRAVLLTAAAEALAAPPSAPEGPAEAVLTQEAPVDGTEEAQGIEAPPAEESAELPFAVPGETFLERQDSEAGSSEAVEVEAPPIAPADLDAGRLPIDIEADQGGHSGPRPEDIETFAARRARRSAKRQRQLWPLSGLQTMILALIVVDSVVVGWRKDVVRLLPQTASFYSAIGLAVNVRGLAFDNIATTMETHEGVPILVVQGDIVNATAAIVDVPRLKLSVRNAAKQDVYSWTAVPPLQRLSPYQAVAFRTRLASPPPDGGDVLVRFLNRRDLVTEGR
jgi:predicted Zn finger-like uncharacterized protein